MTNKIKDLSLLQKLKPGSWLIAEFVLPVFVEPFYQWLRDYISSQPQEDMHDLEGKTSIHIRSADYEPIGRVGVGAYWARDGVIVETRDTIAFVFTAHTDDRKYRVSGNGDPIVLPYFVKMLSAISRKWPDAGLGVEEYLHRLKTLASSLHTEAPARRGRKSEFSREDRDRVVEKWEQYRRTGDAKTLDVFLIDEFGEKEGDSIKGTPIVSRSTFYAWRKDYHARQGNRKKKTSN